MDMTVITDPAPFDLLTLARLLAGRSRSTTPLTALAEELREIFGERAPAVVETMLSLGAHAFRSRFGRPGTADEPFIWSPSQLTPTQATPEEAAAWLAAVLVENEWPLAEVYAFERTGVVLCGAAWDLLDDTQRFAWLEAVYEYQGSH
jgi:hypothetical protein